MTKAECIEQIYELFELTDTGKISIEVARSMARVTIDEYACSCARNIARGVLRGELLPANYPVQAE